MPRRRGNRPLPTTGELFLAMAKAEQHGLSLSRTREFQYQLRSDGDPASLWILDLYPTTGTVTLNRDRPPPDKFREIGRGDWTLMSVVEAAVRLMELKPSEQLDLYTGPMPTEWREATDQNNALLTRIAVAADACQRVLESADDSPTPVADLEAEEESCGRSASEPEPPTLQDANALLTKAGFTPTWIDLRTPMQIFDRATEILHDVMLGECSEQQAGAASWPDNSTPAEMEERGQAVDAVNQFLAARGHNSSGRKTKELYVDVQVLMLGFAASERKRLKPAEPLMPAIEVGLEARAYKKWPGLTFSHCRGAQHPFCIYEHSPCSMLIGSFATSQELLDFLAAECPEPSEEETAEPTIRERAAKVLHFLSDGVDTSEVQAILQAVANGET